MLASTCLTDGVVELRPPRERDVDDVYVAVTESIDEVTPWMEWCHSAYSIAETAEWVRAAGRQWQQDLEYPFVVRRVSDDLVIGTSGLNALDRRNRWANLGYWLRTSATGQGLATRAARLVAGFGFGPVGLERIEILAAVDNQRSRAVALRAGATEEGVARRRLRVHDQTHDAVVFSLLRDDI